MKRAVVILGMHRSGTSALARALSFAGFAPPRDLMQPQADNPKGFWEPIGVVRLNEQILKSLQGSWDQPGPWLISGQTVAEARRSVNTWVRDRFYERARRAIHASFGEDRAVVLKDPRISLFLPFWAAVLTGEGYKPHFVLIHRNPLDVAASLRARNRMTPRHCLQLWAHYALSSIDPRNECLIHAVCAYEDLVQAPVETVRDVLAAFWAREMPAEAEATIRGFIAAGDQHHASSPEALAQSPLAADIVKHTWDMLRQWHQITPRKRVKAIEVLCAAYDDAMLLGGALRHVQLSEPATEASPAPQQSPGERPLLLHYHLFKNAGTSVDEMLKRNFGARWGQGEFEHPGRANVREVQAFLESRPELDAFSSHTANLPPPQVPGRRVIPILFLRHPLARLKSAYHFERKQEADTFGARLAKEQDFVGYVRTLLQHPEHRQARNFQTFRLAFGEPRAKGSEMARARAMLAALPFCGLVEAYESSLERLQALLSPLLPDFHAVAVRSNVTSAAPSNPGQVLSEIDAELGPELTRQLRDANADDLELFRMVSDSYGYGR